MAEPNKYTILYCRLITRAQNRANTKEGARKILGYTEKHHILPKSFKLGGVKDTLNYAYLTAREHLVCHLLLTKMFTGNFKIKMCFALHSMHRIMKRNNQIKLSSWEYKKIKEANSYARSNSSSSMKDKKHRPESIQLMRINAKGFKKGYIPHNKGKKNSPEHHIKQIEGMLRFRKENPEGYQKTLDNLKPSIIREENRKKAIKEKLSGSGNTNFDPNVYVFKHKITLEEVQMTRNDFYKKYNLSPQNVYKLIKETRKSVNGWQLVTI